MKYNRLKPHVNRKIILDIFLNLMMRRQNAKFALIKTLTLSFLSSLLLNSFTNLFITSLCNCDVFVNLKQVLKTTFFAMICWNWIWFFNLFWCRVANVNLLSRNYYFFILNTLNSIASNFTFILIDFYLFKRSIVKT